MQKETQLPGDNLLQYNQNPLNVRRPRKLDDHHSEKTNCPSNKALLIHAPQSSVGWLPNTDAIFLDIEHGPKYLALKYLQCIRFDYLDYSCTQNETSRLQPRRLLHPPPRSSTPHAAFPFSVRVACLVLSRKSSNSYALLFHISHRDERFVVRAVGVVSTGHNDARATCTVRLRPLNLV